VKGYLEVISTHYCGPSVRCHRSSVISCSCESCPARSVLVFRPVIYRVNLINLIPAPAPLDLLIPCRHPMEHRPQTTPVHLALSHASASIFSSCTRSSLSTFLFPSLSSKCSLAALFLYVHELPTVMRVSQYYRRFFSKCAEASSIFFLLAETILAPNKFFSITPDC